MMVLDVRDWKEYYPSGRIWITGKIGIAAELWKHLYNCRSGFKGYEGQPVFRTGEWTKWYDNGQLAWLIKYDEYGFPLKDDNRQYRKDGTHIRF